NTAPSRKKGVPLKWKRRFATSAEADLDAFSRATAIASGIGTMKIRNATGKAAARIHALPRNRKPPAVRQQKNESAKSARRSLFSLVPVAEPSVEANSQIPTPTLSNTIPIGKLAARFFGSRSRRR